MPQNKKPFSKQENLVNAIKKGGIEQDKAIRYLCYDYGLEKSIFKMAKRFNCNESDIEDIFQEAVFLLIKNILNAKFESRSNIKTYTIGIAKNLFLAHSKKKNQLNDYNREIEQVDDMDPESIYIKKEKEKSMQRLLNKIGSPCEKVLTLRALGYAITEIAQEMKWQNTQSAKNAVFKCRKKLRLLIENESLIEELKSMNDEGT